MGDHTLPLAQVAAELATADLLDHLLVATDGIWRVEKDWSLASGELDSATLDSRQSGPGKLFVALPGQQADGRTFIPDAVAAGAVALTRFWEGEDPLLTRSAPEHGVVLISRDPRRAFGLLASRWRAEWPVTLFAVTGRHGKTTTKDFLAAGCAAAGPTLYTSGNLNNELGVPLTLFSIRADHRFAVIEMGASAVGQIAYLAGLAKPRIGVITNAAPAHLAEFGDLDGVIQGKGELLDALPADGTAILNADSPGFNEWSERAPCQVTSFGRDRGDCQWRWWPDQTQGTGSLELDGQRWVVPLPGRHNAANLTAAILAARAAGLDDKTIERGLADFSSSPHRGRLISCAGRELLDDCYNANPVSVCSAAESLVALPGTGDNFAVLGHMAELGAASESIHQQLGRDLVQVGLDTLVAVGRQAAPLATGFEAAGGQVQIFADKSEAACWLAANTVPGDRLLLKGSRSAAMEDVLEMLVNELEPDSRHTEES